MFDISDMVNKYNAGKSLRQLGFEYGLNPVTVKKRLVEQGVKIRSRTEQNKYSPQNQRLYTINDDYFDSMGHNQAYLLGFIAADGTVGKNNNSIKIALASVDKSFLEKIKEELQSNAPINDFEDKNGFTHSEFRFSSTKIKQRLADFGIIPNKTYESFSPQNIPDEYLIDFIRGYFDGDGSVSTAGPSLRFQICGYNKKTLENFINFFYEKYAIPKVNIYKRNNTYYFQYSTSSTKKIFDFLYYKDCFCLPRKYDKYKNLIMK